MTNDNYQVLRNMFRGDEYLQPNYFYFLKHKKLPSKRCFYGILYDRMIIEFIKHFSINEAEIVKAENYDSSNKEFSFRTLMILLPGDMMLYVGDDPPWTHLAAVLFYSEPADKSRIEQYSEFILRFQHESAKVNHIHLLCEEPANGLYTRSFEVKKTELDLSSNYNDDLPPVHELIVSRLNKPGDKGIVFLHGVPGTGKTTYIRHLTSLINKEMFFVPPDLAERLARPDFMAFLIEHPDSVLIIEDAENIIEDRQQIRSSVVANLLNISDGLLSDCLNIQLVCTFNTGISNIDKAFLRKGRVIARYEFKALAAEKARRLATTMELPGTISHDMTLAEIYNLSEPDFGNKEKKRVGYGTSV